MNNFVPVTSDDIKNLIVKAHYSKQFGIESVLNTLLASMHDDKQLHELHGLTRSFSEQKIKEMQQKP